MPYKQHLASYIGFRPWLIDSTTSASASLVLQKNKTGISTESFYDGPGFNELPRSKLRGIKIE
jgi:hypothetical protein